MLPPDESGVSGPEMACRNKVVGYEIKRFSFLGVYNGGAFLMMFDHPEHLNRLNLL